MKNLGTALALAAVLGVSHASAQSVFTAWNFDNLAQGTNLSPSASTGTGTALSVGMQSSGSNFPTANATGPDTSNIDNVVGTDPGVNTGSANNVFRIVGSNGWNSGTAIGTQGAQFDASTAGLQGITATFDLMITSQGESSFEAEYSIDGTTWINAPLTYAGSLIAGNGAGSVVTNSSNPNIVNGTYFQAAASGKGIDQWFNQFTVNLSGVSGVNNDPNFALRIVNAATGTAVTNVSQLQALNNTSGNWRFDDVAFSASPIPEPSTWTLVAGIAALALVMTRRRARA